MLSDSAASLAAGTGVIVWGSSGKLELAYRAAVLRFDAGAPLAPDALVRAVRAYWDDVDNEPLGYRLLVNWQEVLAVMRRDALAS